MPDRLLGESDLRRRVGPKPHGDPFRRLDLAVLSRGQLQFDPLPGLIPILSSPGTPVKNR